MFNVQGNSVRFHFLFVACSFSKRSRRSGAAQSRWLKRRATSNRRESPDLLSSQSTLRERRSLACVRNPREPSNTRSEDPRSLGEPDQKHSHASATNRISPVEGWLQPPFFNTAAKFELYRPSSKAFSCFRYRSNLPP